MSNEVNQILEFEKRMGGMGDRQLLEFVARQNYETSIRLESHNLRIGSLETDSKKISGISGGLTGAFTAVIVSVINYLIGANKA